MAIVRRGLWLGFGGADWGCQRSWGGAMRYFGVVLMLAATGIDRLAPMGWTVTACRHNHNLRLYGPDIEGIL
jgi:hypothetical protein